MVTTMAVFVIAGHQIHQFTTLLASKDGLTYCFGRIGGGLVGNSSLTMLVVTRRTIKRTTTVSTRTMEGTIVVLAVVKEIDTSILAAPRTVVSVDLTGMLSKVIIFPQTMPAPVIADEEGGNVGDSMVVFVMVIQS